MKTQDIVSCGLALTFAFSLILIVSSWFSADTSTHTIRVIDGCEYIQIDSGKGQYRQFALTHKGNCKNH